MKVPVTVRLESRQLDPEGVTHRLESTHEGTWYRQGTAQYVVFHDDAMRTTLKWEPEEWHVFRRGPDLESSQVFRLGVSLESDLSLGGSLLPLVTTTRRLQATKTEHGCELHLEYLLHSGPELIGTFTLLIQLVTHDVIGLLGIIDQEDATHAESNR